MKMIKTNEEKFIAIHKYMDLRIKGFGAGLSEEEVELLQNMTLEEDGALFKAITDLGGTLPEGLKTSEFSQESLAFSALLKGMWIHGHNWAVEQVRKTLSEAETDAK